MHRLVGSVLLVMVACSLSMAQTPRVEVFGGYSFLHEPSENLHGWNGAATVYLRRNLGITADFAGHYSSNSFTAALTTFNLNTHLFSYTFGPTLALHNSSRFTPFAHVLFGGTRFTSKVTSSTINSNGSTNVFTFIGGAGLDIRVGHNLAVRPVQLEYEGLHFTGGWMNNMRYSAGVVFRWGET
jgi:opacity protein-like surface antigen